MNLATKSRIRKAGVGNDKIEGTPLEKLKVKKIVCIREEIYKKIKEDVKKYKLINPVKIRTKKTRKKTKNKPLENRTKKTKKRNNYESSFNLKYLGTKEFNRDR